MHITPNSHAWMCRPLSPLKAGAPAFGARMAVANRKALGASQSKLCRLFSSFRFFCFDLCSGLRGMPLTSQDETRECELIWKKTLCRQDEGKDLETRSGFSGWAPKPNSKRPSKREAEGDWAQTHRRRPREHGAGRQGWINEEARKDPPLEPSEGAWPLDLGFPASSTVREYISVVLSHPVCGHLLPQSQEMNAICLGACLLHHEGRVSVSFRCLITGGSRLGNSRVETRPRVPRSSSDILGSLWKLGGYLPIKPTQNDGPGGVAQVVGMSSGLSKGCVDL